MIDNVISHIVQKLVNQYTWSSSYTDGSKSLIRTSYSFSINSTVQSYLLPYFVSVFTAELTAIYQCLIALIQEKPKRNFPIMTDSLFSLLSLKDPFIRNLISQRIQITLHTLMSQSTRITFKIWIPDHFDIAEHDLLDSVAEQATILFNITLQTLLPL